MLQILCLPTGERLFVKDDYFRLLFETSDLSNASPIALAHCVSYWYGGTCGYVYWLVGLVAWFLLWVQEVLGSIPRQAHCFGYFVFIFMVSGHCLPWGDHTGMERGSKIMACWQACIRNTGVNSGRSLLSFFHFIDCAVVPWETVWCLHETHCGFHQREHQVSYNATDTYINSAVHFHQITG